MIQQGDGSFEKALKDNRCPNCGTEYEVAKFGRCGTCNLTVDYMALSDTIKDSTGHTKEPDMYETRLMPTEEEIMSDALSPEITWNEAVGKIQAIINEYLYDPEPVDDEHEAEVLEAWKRIMRG